ncbi:hypothetical protein DKX38_022547 [Salix brachista]|uniref:Chromo domain-containing protein n=1 Tax=Salix brachista TaxID=2182728 RepID=A0A5N5JZX8_9ROSI|nr:hypothetical protein DKX38_022547 [Salix brachista]
MAERINRDRHAFILLLEVLHAPHQLMDFGLSSCICNPSKVGHHPRSSTYPANCFSQEISLFRGLHNTVADALSRCLEDQPVCSDEQPCLRAISMPLIPLFNSIRMEIQTSDQLQLLLRNIQQGEAIGPWEYKDGLIFFKRRVYLQHSSPILEAIDQELLTRDLVLQDLRGRLLQAQQSMKATYDAKHRPVTYAVGDQVLLKLQPYRQISLSSSKYTKLAPRFYGPFTILAKIGSVAYKLQLPSTSRLHPIFHVSCLKPFHGNSVNIEPTLPTLTQGEIHPLPKAILDSRVMHNKQQVLVHWEGLSPADSSWEDTASFRCKFPSFALVDKCHFNGGSDVMNHVDKGSSNIGGIKVYQRRGRSARIADVDAADVDAAIGN